MDTGIIMDNVSVLERQWHAQGSRSCNETSLPLDIPPPHPKSESSPLAALTSSCCFQTLALLFRVVCLSHPTHPRARNPAPEDISPNLRSAWGPLARGDCGWIVSRMEKSELLKISGPLSGVLVTTIIVFRRLFCGLELSLRI